MSRHTAGLIGIRYNQRSLHYTLSSLPWLCSEVTKHSPQHRISYNYNIPHTLRQTGDGGTYLPSSKSLHNNSMMLCLRSPTSTNTNVKMEQTFTAPHTQPSHHGQTVTIFALLMSTTPDCMRSYDNNDVSLTFSFPHKMDAEPSPQAIASVHRDTAEKEATYWSFLGTPFWYS